MKRKLLSLLLALCMVLAMIPTAFAATVVASGKCGDNATWTLTDDGTLTISGTGAMADYDWGGSVSAPWNSYAAKIKKASVASGITTIGEAAFSECFMLTEITVPNSVTEIGWSAFEECSSLTEITIPNSVTEIGYHAFADCTSLKKVNIPNGITAIGGGTFSYCSSLTEITIPDSVTCINDRAFYNCTSLKKVFLPDSITEIGEYAFYNCTSLTYNESGNGNYLGNTNNPYVVLVSVADDSSTSYTIPANTKIIYDSAFSNCTSLTEITIPDSVTCIGESAFSGCTALKKIAIPDGVAEIGDYAFSDCAALTTVSLPDRKELLVLGWETFSGCSSLKEITLPVCVYGEVSAGLFMNCSSLEKVTFLEDPNHYASGAAIGSSAFYNCTSLKEIALADHVREIYYYAFMGCSALTKITMPDTVEFIDASAFEGCSALTEITIPESVTAIGGRLSRDKGAVGNTFKDCTALKKITFACELPYIADDCFVNTTATAYYPCGSETWTESAVQTLAQENPTITWKVDHVQQTVPGKAPTCTTTGLTEGKACGCGEVVTVKQTPIATTGHLGNPVPGTGKDATCTESGLTKSYECVFCGKIFGSDTIPALGHKYENNVCTVCGDKKVTVEGVDRVYGSSRYDTAFQSADTLKKQMGVEKFSCAIVTSGDNFADALAGSYLAYVKNAPILLTDNDNIGDVMAYIQKNVEKGATVYALGGKAVVTDKLLDLEKKGYDVKRLAGKSRFETNLEILKECGSVAGKDILVCTGFNFADSLSASAAKRPILLVDDKLTDGQKAYLKQQSGCKYCIVGGTGAVTSSVEKSLKSYGSVSRLAGSNRFETSVMVAKKFFSDPTTAVLAYGYNFPDGLCAGPLAATINAPLILTATGDEAQAAAYAKEEGIEDGYVLGGSALINDKAVKKIFSMGSGDKIQ